MKIRTFYSFLKNHISSIERLSKDFKDLRIPFFITQCSETYP